MPESPAATVVIADENSVARERLAALCTTNGMRVIGECSDGLSAVLTITEHKPDFALIDMHLAHLSGVEIVRQVRCSGYGTKIIVVSKSRSNADMTEAIRAGADGFLLKDEATRHFLHAVDFIRRGGVFTSPTVRQHASRLP